MSFQIRRYRHDQDFYRIGDFLIEQYRGGENLLLWVQPRWEYMHFHPLIKETDIAKIGVAEVDGEIKGVVHHEHDEGIIYFQVDADHDDLKEALFDYAEATFGSVERESGRERLAIFVNEADSRMQRLAAERGYQKKPGFREVTSRYDLCEGVPEVALPEGFRLQSLADENDLRKINQVLWRGFDHPGPPPEDGIEGRKEAQEAPNFRHDLTIVAVAPNGDYVSFCGIWFVAANGLTYVEPVATDPDYRRMGLGKGVVLEGIRRTIPLGAEVAWVGSDQEFYEALGFRQSYRETAWVKYR
jgi:predicted N-acetyltransferase YhbS